MEARDRDFLKERQDRTKSALDEAKSRVLALVPAGAQGRCLFGIDKATAPDAKEGDLAIVVRCEGSYFTNGGDTTRILEAVREVTEKYAEALQQRRWDAYVRKELLTVADTRDLDASSFAKRMQARRRG
jgi:hypothetical protein